MKASVVSAVGRLRLTIEMDENDLPAQIVLASRDGAYLIDEQGNLQSITVRPPSRTVRRLQAAKPREAGGR